MGSRQWISPASPRLILPKKNQIQIAIKKDGVRIDKLPGLCWVYVDDHGLVKQIYFNENGIGRLFNAVDMSSEEFANALVKRYSGIPSFDVNEEERNPGRGVLKMTTWLYKDSTGYQVKLFDRSYYGQNGNRYTEKMLERDAEVAMGLGLAGLLPTRNLTISAIKAESERKFD